jgi:hypothetical protein
MKTTEVINAPANVPFRLPGGILLKSVAFFRQSAWIVGQTSKILEIYCEILRLCGQLEYWYCLR